MAASSRAIHPGQSVSISAGVFVRSSAGHNCGCSISKIGRASE
jgi:hypothetical protein